MASPAGKTYNLTPEQLATFTEAFGLFDKTKTGMIEFTELPNMLRSIGQNPTDSMIQKIVTAFDTDASHSMSLDSFLSICDSSHMQDFIKEENLVEAFRQFDKDAKQTLSVGQLRSILQLFGEKLSEAEADSFVDFALSKCEKDKSGIINYQLLVKELITRDPGVQWAAN